MAKNGIDELRQRGVPIAEALGRVKAAADAGVVAPSAMTAPATMNASYTQAEVQQLRTDVANLRATVANLVTLVTTGS